MVYFGGFFAKMGYFAGFSLYIITNAVRVSEAAMGGAGDIIFITLTPNGSKKAWPPRKTPQNDGYVNIINICMSVIQQTVKI